MLDGLFGELDQLDAEVRSARLQARAAGVVDFSRYADDPLGFVRDALPSVTLWKTQEDYLRLVLEHGKVAAYGANGCSKTHTEACIALWWTFARGGYVVVACSKLDILKFQFLRDVKLIAAASPALQGQYLPFEESIRIPANPKAGIRTVAASGPDTFRGLHSDHMMVVLSESQAFDEWVYESASRLVGGGPNDRIIVSGNCVTGTPFHSRCQQWPSLRFDAWDHPNYIERRTVIPGSTISFEGCEDKRREWGEASPFFLESVRGMFPTELPDGLFKLPDIERAYDLWRKETFLGKSARVQLGVDVARYGPDSNVIAPLRGQHCDEFISWKKTSAVVTRERIMLEAAKYGFRAVLPGQRSNGHDFIQAGDPLLRMAPSHNGRIVLDETGVGGPILDELLALGWPCRGFSSAKACANAEQKKKFASQRCAAVFRLEGLLAKGQLALPPSEGLTRQLMAHGWQPDKVTGRRRVTPKDAIKPLLGGASPDLADAILCAVAESGALDFSLNLIGISPC